MDAELSTVTMGEVVKAATALAERWEARRSVLGSVWGVPRGGVTVAALVAAQLGLPLADEPEARTLVVDDLVDSGATLRRYAHHDSDALFRKPGAPMDLAPDAIERDGWLVFPWEVADEEAGPEDSVVRLLQYVGEDPLREGLIDTPRRVLGALTEMTAGYRVDPAELLAIVFTEAHDQMVVLEGIEFTSLCEHHLLPFRGTATVGYIPAKRVVGLSKLARLVDCFAARLQLQERMTDQITDALMDHLQPLGAGAVVRAHHSCMGCRGARKPDAVMSTCSLRGLMLHGGPARSEFLELARHSR